MNHPVHWLTLLAGLMLAFSHHSAHAREGGSGGVGNGGGSWTCRADNADNTLIWAQLVDLSEGRREYGLDIPVNGNLNLRSGELPPSPHDWLAAGNRYLTWVEAKIQQANPAFFAEYQRRKADLLVNRILMPEQSEFDRTSDIFRSEVHHTRPDDASCVGGHIPQDPEQLANFTLAGNLQINPKLWNSAALSEIDRAALFVHEVIYWMYRDFGHDTDSLRTRVIVGYLFAASKPVSQYASMLTLAPAPADAAGLPLVYGMFAEITGHWVDIQVTAYDTATHELQIEQRDRDDHWSVKARATFKCEPRGSEYECHMTFNTRGRPSEWWDRYIRIIDPTDFVWVKLKRNGSVDHATHYTKLQ